MGKNLYICSRKPIVRFTERKRVFSLFRRCENLDTFHKVFGRNKGDFDARLLCICIFCNTPSGVYSKAHIYQIQKGVQALTSKI